MPCYHENNNWQLWGARYKVRPVREDRCVNYNTKNKNKKTSMLKAQENKCLMYEELKLYWIYEIWCQCSRVGSKHTCIVQGNASEELLCLTHCPWLPLISVGKCCNSVPVDSRPSLTTGTGEGISYLTRTVEARIWAGYSPSVEDYRQQW